MRRIVPAMASTVCACPAAALVARQTDKAPLHSPRRLSKEPVLPFRPSRSSVSRPAPTASPFLRVQPRALVGRVGDRAQAGRSRGQHRSLVGRLLAELRHRTALRRQPAGSARDGDVAHAEPAGWCVGLCLLAGLWYSRIIPQRLCTRAASTYQHSYEPFRHHAPMCSPEPHPAAYL